MENTYWQRQTADKPLFPELIWSRPEQKSLAGKLLIIGGNLHAFAAPAEAYAEAEKAGAGAIRVILPDATKKIVGPILEQVEYGPSTPSGSFSQQALAELLDLANWSDGVLIAGDLGRNSETAILLEKFLDKHTGHVTITKDAADYLVNSPSQISNRANTLLVVSFGQLQKLAIEMGFHRAFKFEMDLLNLAEALHELTAQHALGVVVKHLEHIHCAINGNVISHKLAQEVEIWRTSTAARASVWVLQNPSKPLQAVATSLAVSA